MVLLGCENTTLVSLCLRVLNNTDSSEFTLITNHRNNLHTSVKSISKQIAIIYVAVTTMKSLCASVSVLIALQILHDCLSNRPDITAQAFFVSTVCACVQCAYTYHVLYGCVNRCMAINTSGTCIYRIACDFRGAKYSWFSWLKV